MYYALQTKEGFIPGNDPSHVMHVMVHCDYTTNKCQGNRRKCESKVSMHVYYAYRSYLPTYSDSFPWVFYVIFLAYNSFSLIILLSRKMNYKQGKYIEEGRVERSAYCVMMNVRVLVMFCGIVQSTIL